MTIESYRYIINGSPLTYNDFYVSKLDMFLNDWNFFINKGPYCSKLNKYSDMQMNIFYDKNVYNNIDNLFQIVENK